MTTMMNSAVGTRIGSDAAWPDPATWPWPPQWLRVADGRLHYVRAGSGPRVVLVHGTPTWSYEWRHALDVLKESHEAIAFDHLGFGRSERPPDADYSPEAHAARFHELMAGLVPADNVSLVLHDFGGPIGLDWALEHTDRLSHLVIVNSWMWPLEEDPSMKRAARLAGSGLSRLLYRWANASLRLIMPGAYGDRSRLTPAIHAQYLAAFRDADSRERALFALARSLLGSSRYYRTLWDRRDRLADVPVTIIWGMRDSAFKPALLERWREAVPHAAVRPIEGAGHWPHEELPEEFNAVLKAALRT
ncbi:MAG TPA: alpha/beta fold hydrolase [Longimicrobiales bacterium]|nr:alpha/beta fold hydrolase [Longimicrobiales bacterium]